MVKALEIMGNKRVSEERCVFYASAMMGLNTNSTVRKAAIWALGRSQDQDYIESLIMTLIVDEENRKEAARALMLLDKDGRYSRLILAWNQDTGSIVETAQEYIARDKLIQDVRDLWGRDKKRIYAEVMVTLHNEAGIEMLSRLLTISKATSEKKCAIEILGGLEGPAVSEILLLCLIDETESVRLAAVRALGGRASDKVVNALEEIKSKDESADIRFEAETALKSIRNKTL